MDAILLSHDQHADNLDPAGKQIVATAALTLTTPHFSEGPDRVTAAFADAGLSDRLHSIAPEDVENMWG